MQFSAEPWQGKGVPHPLRAGVNSCNLYCMQILLEGTAERRGAAVHVRMLIHQAQHRPWISS
jgi:hypothetical protein